MHKITKIGSFLAIILLSFMALIGCSNEETTTANNESEQLLIVTTIAQIGEPIRIIADGHARVESLMGEGVDPHLYRPTRTDAALLAEADIIISNGLHLEAQMTELLESLSESKPVVLIGDNLDPSLIEDGVGDYPDPHIWMSPNLWHQALNSAVETIIEADPDNADYYRTNATEYFTNLEYLRQKSLSAMATIPENGRILLTAHDAFGYFGEFYNMEVLAIQGISTESEAGLRHIEELVDIIVERNINAIFVETSVPTRNIQALIDGAAQEGHIVTIGGSLFSDAMGAPNSYEGTYIGMLDHNVTTITRALGGTAPETGLYGKLTPTDEGI